MASGPQMFRQRLRADVQALPLTPNAGIGNVRSQSLKMGSRLQNVHARFSLRRYGSKAAVTTPVTPCPLVQLFQRNMTPPQPIDGLAW